VTAIAESVGAVGTAGALVIGLVILFRDHKNAERAQVDLVGAWAETWYERRLPGEPRVEQAKIYVLLRNASELPVEVKDLEYRIRTRWLVPTDDGAWESVDGEPAGPYHLHNIQLRSHAGVPNDFWNNDSTPAEVNLAHTAPERAEQLDLIQGVRCEINSVVVVDNAGREWETRPSGGGRAKPLDTRLSRLRAALVRSRAYTAKILAKILTSLRRRAFPDAGQPTTAGPQLFLGPNGGLIWTDPAQIDPRGWQSAAPLPYVARRRRRGGR
jgi:hypothetical protein